MSSYSPRCTRCGNSKLCYHGSTANRGAEAFVLQCGLVAGQSAKLGTTANWWRWLWFEQDHPYVHGSRRYYAEFERLVLIFIFLGILWFNIRISLTDPQKSTASVDEIKYASTPSFMLLTTIVFFTFLVGGIAGICCVKAKSRLMEAQMDESHRNHFGKPM